MRKIISSIDLGSGTIKFLICELIKEKVNVLCSYDVKSKGIKNGVILNEIEVIGVLKDGIKHVEEIIGLKIKKSLVTMPALSAEFYLGEGEINITNPEKQITGADVIRAIQTSASNSLPSNMELVMTIPVDFRINGEEVVKDPKKITANTLGVKNVLVMSPKKNVYDIFKCFEKAGIEITDILYGIVGDYYTNKNNLTDEQIGAVINLGNDTTTVGIFNKGILTNAEALEIGGSNIDSDISFIYKINRKDAKYLKENFALAHRRMADASETEEIVNKLGEKVVINQYEISEIVYSRMMEILNLAKKQINLLTKKEISYIIITGGLTEIDDFSLIVEEIFGKNVILGDIRELGIRNNKYSNVLGIVKCFDEKLRLRDKAYSIFNATEQQELGEAVKRINVNNDGILGKIFGYFFDN